MKISNNNKKKQEWQAINANIVLPRIFSINSDLRVIFQGQRSTCDLDL